MTTVERTRDRGRRRADRLRQQLGTELRDARLAAGVSQRHVAQVAGLSQPVVSRAERAVAAYPSIDALAVHCAALGLQLSVKVYPDGSPVRDVAQLRLIERLRPQVHLHFRWNTEVPVGGGYGDIRAWDVQLAGPGSIGIDAETRLHDIQALQRRFELKARDSGVERTILLVAETRHNGAILREHREALRSTFPADTATVMGALRRGLMPAANGIIVL